MMRTFLILSLKQLPLITWHKVVLTHPTIALSRMKKCFPLVVVFRVHRHKAHPSLVLMNATTYPSYPIKGQIYILMHDILDVVLMS